MNIDPVKVHRLKNQLAIVLGFSELLLEELAADDPHRADVQQIHLAAKSALGALPPLPAHEFSNPATRSPEAKDGK